MKYLLITCFLAICLPCSAFADFVDFSDIWGNGDPTAYGTGNQQNGEGDDFNLESFSVTNDGTELKLWDNIWVAIDIGVVTLSSKSKLEFSFKSAHQGELQGIILDDNVDHTDGTIYANQLYGTATGSIAFKNDPIEYDGSGDWMEFLIDLSSYAGETVNYIAFVMDDDDAPLDGDAYFKEVSLQSVPLPAGIFLLGSGLLMLFGIRGNTIKNVYPTGRVTLIMR